MLVCVTTNPTNWSFLGWVDHRPYLPASIVLLFGFVLSMGYVHFVRATFSVLGGWAIAGLFCFFFLLLWTLADFGFVSLHSRPFVAWVLLLIVSFVFALGVSWPKIRKGRLRVPKKPKHDDGWDL